MGSAPGVPAAAPDVVPAAPGVPGAAGVGGGGGGGPITVIVLVMLAVLPPTSVDRQRHVVFAAVGV